MDNKSAKRSQNADLYLVELAPQIAQSRHRIFFGTALSVAPQFCIPATAGTWPHERPLQNIDAALATLQQKWVRRLQRQALKAAKVQPGNTAAEAEAACRSYQQAAEKLDTRCARMTARVARRTRSLQPA